MKIKSKRRAIIIAAVVVCCVSLVFKSQDKRDIPFDQKIWKEEAEPEVQEDRRVKSIPDLWKPRDDGNTRLRMINDLKPKLPGRSKAEVINLLGHPTTEFDPAHPEYFYYCVGTREGILDTDGLWLRCRFSDGFVDEIEVIHD